MWCGVVWCGVVWCGVVWCGVVWFGVVWFPDPLAPPRPPLLLLSCPKSLSLGVRPIPGRSRTSSVGALVPLPKLTRLPAQGVYPRLVHTVVWIRR